MKSHFEILAIFFIFLTNVLLISLFTKASYAQVVINEFSSFTQDDWVEIYNIGVNEVDLSAYRLRDTSATNNKDLNGNLAPGAFAFFDFSNYLNKDKDTIYLYLISEGTELLKDSISYGGSNEVCVPTDSGSIGRYPTDGGNTYDRFLNHTKGVTNSGATLFPCPAPTEIPEPTVTNTPSPTNIPTLKPTVTPRPSSVVTPKPTLNQTTEEEKTEDNIAGGNSDIVLGVKEEKNENQEGDVEKNNVPSTSYMLIAAGILVIFASVYLFIKAKKQNVI